MTSSGFLERLKTRDPQAWQQLADVYGPLVYFWCPKYGVKSDDAADICGNFSAMRRVA